MIRFSGKDAAIKAILPQALRAWLSRTRRKLASVSDSVDHAPWRHPFLTTDNLVRFRRYSAQVWNLANEFQARQRPGSMHCAFAVNIAQNMYKWACMAQRSGCDATLFLHPMDGTAISRPEWEEFDGEFPELLNAERFLDAHPDVPTEIPWRLPSLEGGNLFSAAKGFKVGDRRGLLRLLADSPGLRHEVITHYKGVYPYYPWARALADFDVIYAASVPIAAYLSGRPYCVFSVGGDLQFDCGRADDYGQLMSLTFNAAQFLLVSNPHTLGHSRRLGLINGVYLPYPMDDGRYSPGDGNARADWEAATGPGVFVLTTCRIDSEVKGFGHSMIQALIDLARSNRQLRFVMLAWGTHADQLRRLADHADVGRQFLVLSPVGKRRLIDYYRSCDIVLDQLVYGYYGASALEAASIGKPIVMHHRVEHYAPLYENDVAPMLNATTPVDVFHALARLAESAELRSNLGTRMREWLVRNHGEQRTMPILLALLTMTAHRAKLPPDLVSPLCDELSEAELTYHASCIRGARHAA